MSLNIYELKEQVMTVIRDNEYSVDDLRGFLGPVSEFINSPNFINHLKEIVEELLRDRNGDDQFSIDDLKLLGEDALGITTLVNAILLVIGSVPEFKLKYDGANTEELIFKTFGFIFLVVIPKETNHPWSEDEKEKVVDLVLSIYNVFKSSQLTQDLVANIAKWFKKKGWCKCMSGDEEERKEEVVRAHMPQFKAQLRSHVQKDKDAAKMQREIRALRAELNEIKN